MLAAKSNNSSEKKDNLCTASASGLEGEKMLLNTRHLSVVESKKSRILPEVSSIKQVPMVKTKSRNLEQKKSDSSMQGCKSQRNDSKLFTFATTTLKLDQSKVFFKPPTVDCYELTSNSIIRSNTGTLLRRENRRLRKETMFFPSEINRYEKCGKGLKVQNSIYAKLAQSFVKFDKISLVKGTQIQSKVEKADDSTLKALKAVKKCNLPKIEISNEKKAVKKFVIRLPPLF